VYKTRSLPAAQALPPGAATRASKVAIRTTVDLLLGIDILLSQPV